MKRHYQNCECRYQRDIGRGQTMQTKSCEECELYSKDQVRITRGCAEPTSCGVVIIIILIIILL